MRKLSIIGVILTLCAAFLWGTAGTAQSFVRGATSPYWIGALRLIVACFFFHTLLLYRRRYTQKQPSDQRDKILETPSNASVYWLSIAVTGICMGLYNLAFFAGIKATGIAIGTATTIGSAPIWAGVMQAIMMKKSPARLWWLGTLCATVGGTWMVLTQNASWHVDPLGLLICLSAGFCYALYTLVSKRLVTTAAPLIITTHTFSVAVLVAAPLAWFLAGTPTISAASVAVILYLGIFTTGVAYLLYTQALKHISAATGVALGLIEPIVAFALAVTVAGESVNRLAIVGLCLILAGLWLVLRSEGQRPADS
jgi:DME family drug/metabolite transporter